MKGERVLDDATVQSLRSRLPHLFRGECDTGVYPDEMHWREGISKDDAPREVCGGVEHVAIQNTRIGTCIPPNNVVRKST